MRRRLGSSWRISCNSFLLRREDIYFLEGLILGFERMMEPNLLSIVLSCWLRLFFFSLGYSRSILIFYYTNHKFHRNCISYPPSQSPKICSPTPIIYIIIMQRNKALYYPFKADVNALRKRHYKIIK